MIHFTSDTHFDHANIVALAYRPFAFVTEMNSQIIERHNAVVGPDDTVYHLGDFSFRTTASAISAILSCLNGRHILIAGNHDTCSNVHRRWAREVRRYIEAGFAEVHQQLVIETPGLGIVQMNHFPLFEESDADAQLRYLEFRPRVLVPEARIQLCGHVHDRWRHRGRSINVGVDQWNFTPVNEAQISSFLSSIQAV